MEAEVRVSGRVRRPRVVFHPDRRVEVVTGVNLPMLIKLATLREEKDLEELAGFVKDYGRRNISVAREILPEEGS